MCYFLCFFCLTMPCLSKWVASLFLVLFVIPCFSFACRISFEGARPWAMTLQRGTTSLRIHLGSDSGYRLPHFGLPLLFVQFVRGICFPLVSFSFPLAPFFLFLFLFRSFSQPNGSVGCWRACSLHVVSCIQYDGMS